MKMPVSGQAFFIGQLDPVMKGTHDSDAGSIAFACGLCYDTHSHEENGDSTDAVMGDREMKKERSKGILWRILFGLSALLTAAWLELGKHTVWGWVLTALAFAGWYIVRTRVWKKWNAGRKWLA